MEFLAHQVVQVGHHGCIVPLRRRARGGHAAEIAGRGRGLGPRDMADALPDALLAEAEAERGLGLSGILLDLPPAR